jgi:hypothetical protein
VIKGKKRRKSIEYVCVKKKGDAVGINIENWRRVYVVNSSEQCLEGMVGRKFGIMVVVVAVPFI